MGSTSALGHWIPPQVGLSFTPYPVPIPTPVILPVFAGVSLLSPCSAVGEPSCGWREQGMGAVGLVGTVPLQQGAAGWRSGAAGWGPCRGIWGGSSVCPNPCLSFPMRETPQGHAWFSAPVPNPRPCPRSVPPCLAIALSPAWVSDTMPTPGTVSSPDWCHRVQAQALSQCRCAPSWMLSPGQCPQPSVPSGEMLVPLNQLPPSLLSLPLSL